jgi:hypothetical protein
MRLPGFRATASLYNTRENHLVRARHRGKNDLVGPASSPVFCENECMDTCADNAPDCWELQLPPGPGCRRALHNYFQECSLRCCGR